MSSASSATPLHFVRATLSWHEALFPAIRKNVPETHSLTETLMVLEEVLELTPSTLLTLSLGTFGEVDLTGDAHPSLHSLSQSPALFRSQKH